MRCIIILVGMYDLLKKWILAKDHIMLMQIASMHIKNVLYGRSNETNEESECSQNGKYIDKVPRDLRHILNFPSQFYLALLP